MNFGYRFHHRLRVAMVKGFGIGPAASLYQQPKLVKGSYCTWTSHLQPLNHDSKIVYAFITHPRSSIASYSLYNFCIPITANMTEMDPIHNPTSVFPALMFPPSKFPSFKPMGFAGLDSSLYFLGGEFHYDDHEHKEDHPTYPFSAKVYVYDYADRCTNLREPMYAGCKSVLQEVASMHTGKPNLQAFVFDGKIYALGSSDKTTMIPEKCKYFEVYNPETDKWSTLPDPTWEKNSSLARHIVLYRKLYAFVNMPDDKCRVFVFDLVKENWITSFEYFEDYIFKGNSASFSSTLVDDTLYECPSIDGATNIVKARGPLPGKEESSNMNDETVVRALFSKEVCISPGHHNPVRSSSASLLHFANKLVCHVLSGHSGEKRNGDDNIEYWDESTLHFSINVFELSGSGWPLAAAEAICIQSCHFISRIPSSAAGHLVGTCLFSYDSWEFPNLRNSVIWGVEWRRHLAFLPPGPPLEKKENVNTAGGMLPHPLQVQLTPGYRRLFNTLAKQEQDMGQVVPLQEKMKEGMWNRGSAEQMPHPLQVQFTPAYRRRFNISAEEEQDMRQALLLQEKMKEGMWNRGSAEQLQAETSTEPPKDQDNGGNYT